MSYKANNALVTKTKVIFTVNDFDVNRKSIFESEDFIIGSNVWQIIIIKVNGVYEPELGIGLRLKSGNRLLVGLDTFIYDSYMKKCYQFFGKKCTDFSKWRTTTLITKREFMSQKSKLFPDNCLKMGVIITEYKEVYEWIQRGFGYRNTFNVKELNDFRVVCDFKEFFVSKAILSSHSEVFEKMFTNDITEQKTLQMIVEDIDEEVVEEFLKFIYFRTSDKLEELKEDLLIIADKYQVLDLKTICENLIFVEICDLNAIKLLIFFNKYNCNEMADKTLDFISNNLWDVCIKAPFQWEDLVLRHNHLLVKITQRMAYLIKNRLFDDKPNNDSIKSYSFSYIK